MKKILPGIQHWTRQHPEIGIEVSSYYLEDERVLIDPLIPAEGLKALEDKPPQNIILSNRLHVRESSAIRERFGCRVWVHQAALEQDFELDDVSTFQFGELLPGRIEAIPMGDICPDDTALFIPKAGGIMLFADGLVRTEQGALGFVPDSFMAERPEQQARIKTGLRKSLRAIAASRTFDHLFFAHGAPIVTGGKAILDTFCRNAG